MNDSIPTKKQDSLLSRLLLNSPDATATEYLNFKGDLIEYYFSRLLHIHNGPDRQTPISSEHPSLPMEYEIKNLLNSGHPELFLSNIVSHLRRNNRFMPGVFMPGLCSLFRNQPEQWDLLYQLQSELVMALAHSNEEWMYMRSAFDPEHPLTFGESQFYPALRHRMRNFPIRTSKYIRDQFQKESVHHQARLLDVLAIDLLPENHAFICDQISHSRKEVRLVALRYAILNKESDIYEPLKKQLIYSLNRLNSGLDANTETIKLKTRDLPWKDLGSLCEEHLPLSIMMALIDPEDYKGSLSKLNWENHKSVLWKAALFHQSQDVIYQMVSRDPELLTANTALNNTLHSETALRLLRHLWIDNVRSLDSTFIDLLKIITPFLNEKDTDALWTLFVHQWKELPFTLESLDLEVLALRIHPNKIRIIWQHPLLQDTAAPLQKIREILKNRLGFLKKCYQ